MTRTMVDAVGHSKLPVTLRYAMTESVSALRPIRSGRLNVPNVLTKVRIPPVSAAGAIKGKVTRQKVCQGLAPVLAAAFSTFLSVDGCAVPRKSKVLGKKRHAQATSKPIQV